MQIELIETFLDLCDTQSFNKTADKLGITQSTVSGRVKALERTVGRKLFQRSRAGTALTTEGLRFEPHARSLLYNWVTALNATRDAGMAGVTMRVGLQHDLISASVSTLIAAFRDALPDTVFYFEADYSGQICSDLISGVQDVAVLYTPQQHPDLQFEMLGDAEYVMVSTKVDQLGDIAGTDYILANYAPAFAQAHASLLPELTRVSLSIGQNAAMVDLLKSLSGTAYVMRHSADALVQSGQCLLVKDAPPIAQPVFAGVNTRNRHRAAYRKLIRTLHQHFGAGLALPTNKRRRR